MKTETKANDVTIRRFTENGKKPGWLRNAD